MGEAVSVKGIESVFRWAASKILVGATALLTVWLWLAMWWPLLTTPNAYLGPSLQFLIEQTHPWGVLISGVALALVVGDGLMLVTGATIRLYSRWRVRRFNIHEDPPEWSKLDRRTLPFSERSGRRFLRYLEDQNGYEDILFRHRPDLVKAAFEAVPSMIARAGHDSALVEKLQAAEAESIFRMSLAPWVVPIALLSLFNVAGLPPVATTIAIGASVLLAGLLAISGWFAWRDAQSGVLDGLCDRSADISSLIKDFALRA